MKKYLLYIVSLGIAAVVIFPRFYHLGSQPPGLHIDEVSFAADAKAIAETGHDTWNVAFPRVFKAFGEWKAPGLTYSMAFWSKVTGKMNNAIARLPSAVAGLTSLVMIVLIARELYPAISPYVLLLIVLVLAYSPWHFDMSRIFYEAFSALSWMTVSLYLATRKLLHPDKVKKYEWFALIVTAAIAGYYYASIRYVVILYILIISFLLQDTNKLRIRTGCISLVLLLIVGSGWVGDLFSTVGLNRFHYYQQKSNLGSALEIDEKRQFCYLSFNRDPRTTKACYLLWNKPVAKLTGGIQTIQTYLGTEFLFVKGESEFGFDSQYGAFLPPMIVLYIVGLFKLLSGLVRYTTSFLKKKKSAAVDKVYALYCGLALLALAPAAAALNLNMRMAMIPLFIVTIAIAVGFVESIQWLRTNTHPILRAVVYCAFGALWMFYVTQSMFHYFLVFTHSNDLQWTSDAGEVFGFVKSISSQYDRIIDTELHGPLAPYFYGDISTYDVQHGEHSKPDDLGFTYLVRAGKYELIHKNVLDLACTKWGESDKRKTLIIINKPDQSIGIPLMTSLSWNKVYVLHQVYDLDTIIQYQLDHNNSFKETCTKK